MAEEVFKRLHITATTDGVDQAAASVNKMAGAEANLAVTSQNAERATLSLDKAFANLERRNVEGVKQQQELARIQQTVNAAVAQNPALQERANAVLAGATTRLNLLHAANQNVAASTGLARHEVINLGRQGADVFTQLASGQSLFITAVQQGPQVLDVLATSQAKVGDVFKSAIGWAGTFLTSTTGIVTSVLAIGGAAIFAATQFARATTTIEQALEEQNRLLKEGKALLDARTSAEARAQLQSKEQTQFETLRNQLDLQVKLNRAMEDAAAISRRRATRPTEVPGEMGVAPTAFAALTDPGLDKMTAAFAALKEAQAAGLPGIKQYNAELSKIGLAHPELALVVQDMIKAGEAGLQLEFAAQRAKAMADALAGIATNAQLAAVGLKSIAQFKLDNAQGEEDKARAERKAVVGLQSMETFGTKSPDIANTLAAQKDQLAVANALGAASRMAAEGQAKYNQQLRDGIDPSDALRVAAGERAAKQAEINTAAEQELRALQGQLPVAQATTGAAQMEAQHRETIRLKQEQGLSLARATQIADAQRALSVAQVNAGLDQQLKSLQEQSAVLRGASELDQVRIKAAQDYKKAVDDGGDSLKASAVAAQTIANARSSQDARAQAQADQDAASAAQSRAQANAAAAQQMEREAAAAEQIRIENARIIEQTKFVPFSFRHAGDAPLPFNTETFTTKSGGVSQFNPKGYEFKTSTPMGMFANEAYGPGGFSAEEGNTPWSGRIIPNAQGYGFQTDRYLSGSREPGSIVGAIDQLLNRRNAFDVGGFGGPMFDQAAGQTFTRLLDLLPDDQKIGKIEAGIAKLYERPETLARDELIKSLTDQLKQLQDATENNTNALNAQLDPLFSQGHDYLNSLRIGYYKAASGFDGIARGGTPGVDSIPFRAMVQDGERITITPRGGFPSSRVSNDNSKNVTQNITQNINIGGGGSVSPLTARQMAQGFIAGAARAAG